MTIEEIIATAVLLALKEASGTLTKEDLVGVVRQAMRDAARAEMLREFPEHKV